MLFDADEMTHNEERREWVGEASELGLKPGTGVPRNFHLSNCPMPGMGRSFEFDYTDESGGDIAGWWFREMKGPNWGNDSYKGGRNQVEPFKVLIIND